MPFVSCAVASEKDLEVAGWVVGADLAAGPALVSVAQAEDQTAVAAAAAVAAAVAAVEVVAVEAAGAGPQAKPVLGGSWRTGGVMDLAEAAMWWAVPGSQAGCDYLTETVRAA